MSFKMQQFDPKTLIGNESDKNVINSLLMVRLMKYSFFNFSLMKN